ncbi:MAG TPA: hypothetical protein VE685_15485 [Thermoanaerobaculia bacterium]|nr:hypothetical protein [Thermoanaerobaculia bacterium]
MIAFVTLLLGLVSGSIPIQVTVEGPVAAVEYVLDGTVVAKAEFPPWSATVDFGPELQPRELVARALDKDGNEIARAVQWVNLPRPPAEVEIVLENDAEGRPTAARLAWQSLTHSQPATLSVTLNGKPLLVQEDRRVLLPAYDPKATQILTAELQFAPGLVARKDVVFGGEWGSAVSTELTAVPVRVPKKAVPPTPENLQGRLTNGERPLSVAAVDDGPGKVLVVRVPEASEVANALLPLRTRRVTRDFPDSQIRPEDRRFEMRLGPEDTIRLLSPSASVYGESGIPSELFNTSRELTREDGGLLWFLFRTALMKGTSEDQRIADAVAVAGLQAATGNYRRAVVLVLGSDLRDTSRYNPATARRYLESMRVPLFVWSLEKPKKNPALDAWGPVEDISSLSKLHRAFGRLESELESQRIVWVEGRHLPQSIALAPGTVPVELLPVQSP